MNLEDVLPSFQLYLEVEKGYTEATIKSYTADIELLINFLQRTGDTNLSAISTNLIRNFLVYLKKERNNDTSTIARRIHCYRTLFRFLESQGDITKNPMNGISTPPKKKRLPKYFETDDLKKLIEVPEQSFSRAPLRNKAILCLLIFCGLRRSEVSALDWLDCEFSAGTLRVMGKGQKERLVPIHPYLRDTLWDYLGTRLPLKNNAMFISHYGNRMSVGAIVAMFRKYLKTLGLDNKGLSLHSIRHAFATHLLRSGVDLSVIKELMGHADISSTTIYTHLNHQQLKDAVEKLPINIDVLEGEKNETDRFLQ